MNFRIFAFRPVVPLAAAGLIAALMTAGCTSASLDDAAVGVRNTGAYPNLNIAPKVATTQFTPAEQASGTAALQAAQARQRAQSGGSTVAASDAATLRRLGQTHADEALRQIER